MCEYVIEHGRSHTCPLRRATFGEVVHMVGLIEGCRLSILLKTCQNRRVREKRRVGGEEETVFGNLVFPMFYIFRLWYVVDGIFAEVVDGIFTVAYAESGK
jgi:hypothetical protein